MSDQKFLQRFQHIIRRPAFFIEKKRLCFGVPGNVALGKMNRERSLSHAAHAFEQNGLMIEQRLEQIGFFFASAHKDEIRHFFVKTAVFVNMPIGFQRFLFLRRRVRVKYAKLFGTAVNSGNKILKRLKSRYFRLFIETSLLIPNADQPFPECLQNRGSLIQLCVKFRAEAGRVNIAHRHTHCQHGGKTALKQFPRYAVKAFFHRPRGGLARGQHNHRNFIAVFPKQCFGKIFAACGFGFEGIFVFKLQIALSVNKCAVS